MPITLDDIVSLSKRRGFIYPTSEIYGGLANAYDYGPLGTELMRNLKNLWWKRFISDRTDMVGIDTQIILHPETWVASGHVGSFTDPLVEDKKTHQRFRADHLIETWLKDHPEVTDVVVEDMSVADMAAFITTHQVTSPAGNPVTEPKAFNLLFETALGTVSGDKAKVYLRGETAQGIFSNFKQILDSTRVQLPFGVGQMGKAFRNEITQGQFVFRTFEFEQAEIEYFFNPETTDWHELMESWKQSMWKFITEDIGIDPEHLRWRQHSDKERSHYSIDTFDLDYQFPFGFKELWGIAYRSDYDLKQHIEHAGAKLEYTDPQTGAKVIPHVIEPALGMNRLLLMILCDRYWQDEANNRIVLKLPAKLAPYTVAVFPLLKNKPELIDKAKEVFNTLQQEFPTVWDDRGNIGKRYYYQDEIGTPFCVTIDFDSLNDNSVTIRDRDTATQTRISIDELASYIHTHLK